MNRVILIEDDNELARMYERMFRLSGYEVLRSGDGKDALEKIFALPEQPSAILLDIMIPSLSGIDVLRTLKADERTANIPVIMLTNSFSPDNEQLFLSLGASLYITKMDNDAKNVVRRVNECIAQVEQPRAPAEQ